MSRWFAVVALYGAFLCSTLAVGDISAAVPIDLQLLSENKIFPDVGGIISDQNAMDNKGGNYRPSSSSEEDTGHVDSDTLPFYDSGMSCCRNVTAILGALQMRINSIGHKLDEEYFVLMDEGVLIDEMLEVITHNNEDLNEEESTISSLSTLAKYVSAAWLALVRALITLNSSLENSDD